MGNGHYKKWIWKTNKRESNPDMKQMNRGKGEFFEGLDFLVTFLAMKKVTMIVSKTEMVFANFFPKSNLLKSPLGDNGVQ